VLFGLKWFACDAIHQEPHSQLHELLATGEESTTVICSYFHLFLSLIAPGSSTEDLLQWLAAPAKALASVRTSNGGQE
jgi:hypothetical protein